MNCALWYINCRGIKEASKSLSRDFKAVNLHCFLFYFSKSFEFLHNFCFPSKFQARKEAKRTKEMKNTTLPALESEACLIHNKYDNFFSGFLLSLSLHQYTSWNIGSFGWNQRLYYIAISLSLVKFEWTVTSAGKCICAYIFYILSVHVSRLLLLSNTHTHNSP